MNKCHIWDDNQLTKIFAMNLVRLKPLKASKPLQFFNAAFIFHWHILEWITFHPVPYPLTSCIVHVPFIGNNAGYNFLWNMYRLWFCQNYATVLPFRIQLLGMPLNLYFSMHSFAYMHVHFKLFARMKTTTS